MCVGIYNFSLKLNCPWSLNLYTSGRDCVKLWSIVLLSLMDNTVSITMQGTHLGNFIFLLDWDVIAISNWQIWTLCITQLESKNLRQRSDGTCRCVGSSLWSVSSYGEDMSLYMMVMRITNFMFYFLRTILFPTYYSNLLLMWPLHISAIFRRHLQGVQNKQRLSYNMLCFIIHKPWHSVVVLSEYGHERWPKHVGVTFISKLLQ